MKVAADSSKRGTAQVAGAPGNPDTSAEAARNRQATEMKKKVEDLVKLSRTVPKGPVYNPEAISAQRVEQLRALIEAGTYHIPGVAVAEKIQALSDR